jgi:hypothetical protein
MLVFVGGEIGNFRSDIPSQMTNYISRVWDLCQVVSSGGWLISVEFGAVVSFKKILESSSWGVAIVWVIGEPVAVFFVSLGSSGDFFLSERLSWLGQDDFQAIVVLVIFGFERVHVSSCRLISARARGEFGFVKLAN